MTQAVAVPITASPVSLSLAVMAHPVRRPFVEELVESLGGAATVAWAGNETPSKVPQDRWRTGRAAWEVHDTSAEWHVVLQDDAVVCVDFAAGLAAALAHVPDGSCVSAYIGGKAGPNGRPGPSAWRQMATRADAEGSAWLVSPTLSWGVAVACRTEDIEDMVTYCERRVNAPYDTRLAGFFRQRRRYNVWHPYPSLADHRDAPSLIGHADRGRNSVRFLAGSALDVDWSAPALWARQSRQSRQYKQLDRRPA